MPTREEKARARIRAEFGTVPPLQKAPPAAELWALLAKADGLEIGGCTYVAVGEAHGEPLIEIEGGASAGDAHFWTVYAHMQTGGVDAIRDFWTLGEARAYARALLAKAKRQRLALPFGIVDGNMPERKRSHAHA